MKKSKLILDFNNMMSGRIGNEGITAAHVNGLKPRIKAAHNNLKQKREDGHLGFSYLPYDVKMRDDVKKTAEVVSGKFDNFVVLNAGGSAAGTKALAKALKHPFYNMLPSDRRKGPKLFIIDHADPETCFGLLELLDLKKTIINIISKSGDTPETISFMKVLWNNLETKLGKGKIKEHIIITTARDKGFLKALANKHGIISFVIPENVGGRFSVLSPCGLLPLACMGINIEELLKGAAYMDTLTSGDNVWNNPAYMMAVLHYLSGVKFKRNVSVIMPYSDALKEMADFFAVLWSGSLGKQYSVDGQKVNAGLTPVKSLGTSDQHSQMQLYLEGPFDKTITFIQVEKFREDIAVPSNFAGEDAASYLSGQKMSKLFSAQYFTAASGLAANKRANMTITLPVISEFTLGQLVYLFEVQTAFMAELYNVNAFDQPGVEPANTAVYGLMGRKGYKELIKKTKAVKTQKRFVI